VDKGFSLGRLNDLDEHRHLLMKIPTPSTTCCLRSWSALPSNGHPSVISHTSHTMAAGSSQQYDILLAGM
jgi:hypothetical protein